MLLHRCASFVAKALALQASANAFPAGSSAFVAALLPQESSWPARLEVSRFNKEGKLASHIKNRLDETNHPVTEGSEAQGGEGQRYAPASLR